MDAHTLRYVTDNIIKSDLRMKTMKEETTKVTQGYGCILEVHSNFELENAPKYSRPAFT